MQLTHLAYLIASLVVLAAFVTVALAIFLPARVPVWRRWPSEAVERRLREVTAQLAQAGEPADPALRKESRALTGELKRRGLAR
jgi:hypothetical protein